MQEFRWNTSCTSTCTRAFDLRVHLFMREYINRCTISIRAGEREEGLHHHPDLSCTVSSYHLSYVIPSTLQAANQDSEF